MTSRGDHANKLDLWGFVSPSKFNIDEMRNGIESTAMKLFCQKFFFCTALGLLCLYPRVSHAKADRIAVLLSREITPYVSMVSGLEQVLGSQSVQRFFIDEQGQPFTLTGREPNLAASRFDARIAIGPEALVYLQSLPTGPPLFYGMILNPRNILVDPQFVACGVALNLSFATQLKAIKQQLPTLKRIGILFDPVNNQSWFEQAQAVATQHEVKLLPLQVRRVNGRIELVGDFTQPDALMFIPDKSIISQAVIQYVIKQAVFQRKPVVGYNQFFLDSGAAMAFVIDYRLVGQQVADQVESVLGGHECIQVEPAFQLKRNPQVWQALDLSPDKETP